MRDLHKWEPQSVIQHQAVESCIFFVAIVVIMVLFFRFESQAQVVYQNTNGYEVVFEDDARLLTETQAMRLQEEMKVITEYGNVAFKTITKNSKSTSSFAKSYYDSLWGNESGTVFLIDMDNREIYIRNNGAISKVITNAYSNTITDNVYTYASAACYYTCASKTYEQIFTLLEGGKIYQPMKYTCNFLFSLAFSFVFLYLLVKGSVRADESGEEELLEGMQLSRKIDNFKENFLFETVRHCSDSSGGGGGSSGGGGGSGGSHSF